MKKRLYELTDAQAELLARAADAFRYEESYGSTLTQSQHQALQRAEELLKARRGIVVKSK